MARARALVARWMPVLKVVGFVAGIALIAVTGVAAVRGVEVDRLTWTTLALALIPGALWWLGLVRLWSVLLAGRWARADAALWTRTQVLRYLPGGFWGPVSRVVAIEGAPLQRVAVVAAENVIALCASLAVGGLCLTLAGWSPLWLGLLAALGAPLMVASRTRPEILTPARVLHATTTATGAFVAYVVCAALVQDGVSGHHAALATAGAAAIAWAAGLVVVFAPGGLGVREVVYVALLHGQLDHGQLAAGAAITRIVTIIVELVVFLVIARPGGRMHDRPDLMGT
jgi:uncharacterized membrane protein YbhN (UPF0104 family)